MKFKAVLLIAISIMLINFKSNATNKVYSSVGNFNIEMDLLLVQFDCKTDVDDLHTAAALATLMSNANYSKIHYHAVAGTYGIQEGLYVPPNDLFQLAFGDNWTDANENLKNAIEEIKLLAKETLERQGDIWIAEAGQSNFTAGLIKAIQVDLPEINISQRIHVVQHSGWNEKVTSLEALEFVKNSSDYQKIADGNAVGNGTPGFRSPQYNNWRTKFTNVKLIEIWQLATELANKYNGEEGRYKNEAILAGGLDFSDLSEVCWILGMQNSMDTEEFFNVFAN